MENLNELILRGCSGSPDATELEKAIAAAYWAGQSAARAEERQNMIDRVASFDFGRYHRLQQAVIDHLYPDHERRATEGLRVEALEIRDWDFDL